MIFFETGRRFKNLSASADIVFTAVTWITIGSLPSFAKIDLPSWGKMDRFVYGAAFGPSYYYIQWCKKISQFSGTTGADGIMLKVAWKSMLMAWNFVVTQVYEPCSKSFPCHL